MNAEMAADRNYGGLTFDLDLDLQNWVPLSKNVCIDLSYVCAKFGAFGKHVTVITISHHTNHGTVAPWYTTWYNHGKTT